MNDVPMSAVIKTSAETAFRQALTAQNYVIFV